MNRNIPRQAVNTDRTGSFNHGVQDRSTPDVQGSDLEATYMTESGGDALNGGRANLSRLSEVHYGEAGTHAIANNPGAFTGRDNAPR